MITAQHPLLESFSNGDLLISEAQASQAEACLLALLNHEHGQTMLDDRAFNDDNFWPAPDDWEARYRPYEVRDGVLRIPVQGMLLHNFGYTVGDWVTGYTYIQRAFERGCADPAVRAIAFITHSPGGYVAGCWDAVDKMYALKLETGKPVRAFAHEGAYSAAYGIIGGVADHIVVSRTGGVGSIGVVTSHIDASGMMEQWGLKRTWVFKGKHKVDGNSDEPLPDAVKARMLARITEPYEVFVSTVARNRTQLSADAIRETEAQCFTASEALSNGLADSIGPLDDALSAFVDELSSTEGENEMSIKDTAAVDQAAIDTARAEGHGGGHAEGYAAGVADTQTRIAAILGSDEAKGREGQASYFAFKTDMAADAAIAALAAGPKAAAPESKGGGSFEDAMSKENPDVGAEGGEGGKQDEDPVARVNALGAAMGLKGFTK